MNRYKYISRKESDYAKRWNLKLSTQTYGDWAYFQEIANELANQNSVVVVKGRQVGLSTFARWFALERAYDGRKSVMISHPLSDGARRDRQHLAKQINMFGLDEPQVYRDFLVFDKRGQILSTSDLSATKGVRVDVSIKDECDLLQNHAYAGYEATMAHGGPFLSFDFGTPIGRGEGNVLIALWSASDQREFHVRCQPCGSYFRLSSDNCNHRVFCPDCKHSTSKASALRGGKWVPMNPGARRAGFRVPSFLCPKVDHEASDIYRNAWGEDRFKMEFEGRFLHE